MTAQTQGIQKSIQNSTDWISLLQTADGALNEMSNILQRIRELAVQAVNDTNNDSDRSSLNQEVEELVSELDRISTNTEFNGINLLNGGINKLYMQLGSNQGEDEQFSIRKLGISQLGRGYFGGPLADRGVDPNVGFNNLSFRVDGQIPTKRQPFIRSHSAHPDYDLSLDAPLLLRSSKRGIKQVIELN